jgi:two-component system osmolarity sensor histidine kinase EnvZ
MSSSQIERGRDSPPLFAELAGTAADARMAGADSHRRWFKRMLPRSLYGRSLLILVLPLVLAQVIATWVFYDRHWDTVARRLSASVAADIALALDSLTIADDAQQRQIVFDRALADTELYYGFRPGETLPKGMRRATSGRMDDYLADAISQRLGLPFQIDGDFDPRDVLVSIQTSDGVMEVAVPKKRLFTPTTYIFMMWMVGSSLVLMGVAVLFMRNQVRSLRRLAVAADDFGKGRDVPHFRIEGATEVRQVGAAFLKMRERIQRQITQRTEMLAGVSHDLRTPLTRMRLTLELQKNDAKSAELKSDLAIMERMVKGYIDFARGEGTEETRDGDLSVLVNDIVNTMGRAGTPVLLALPESCHLPLRPDAMRRCLGNLVANARRYGKHVWVTLVENKDAVEVLVDDDGPGIPHAERENVFRPFFRLDPSRNPETGGTGLGLAIARDVARGHGGDILLEDSPQGGLRARLRLPK